MLPFQQSNNVVTHTKHISTTKAELFNILHERQSDKKMTEFLMQILIMLASRLTHFKGISALFKLFANSCIEIMVTNRVLC